MDKKTGPREDTKAATRTVLTKMAMVHSRAKRVPQPEVVDVSKNESKTAVESR
jgi:hypothetical protein